MAEPRTENESNKALEQVKERPNEARDSREGCLDQGEDALNETFKDLDDGCDEVAHAFHERRHGRVLFV